MSFFTQKGRFRPFALCECDSNCLDGNILAFFDGFRFVQTSLQGTILSEESKGQVQENFTPGQGIVFRNLTPGQGSFSDFQAAPPRMFVDQVVPTGTEFTKRKNIYIFRL